MIILDLTWIGIRELKHDVSTSIQKYGFAQTFRHIKDNVDMYDCIVPDEEEGNYIMCQMSITDVRDIVNEHPEIPEPNVEKQTIGDLLYLIYLYCDLYEEIDFTQSDRFNDDEWCIDDKTLKDSIDNDSYVNRRFTKMNLESAKRVLKILDVNPIDRFVIKAANRRMSYSERERTRATNSIIYECEDILKKHGIRLPEFMSRIKRDYNGDIYWKIWRNKNTYHLLT